MTTACVKDSTSSSAGCSAIQVSTLVCKRCWNDIFSRDQQRPSLPSIISGDLSQNQYEVVWHEVVHSIQEGCGWCSFIGSLLDAEVPEHQDILNISYSIVSRGPEVTPKGGFGLYLSMERRHSDLGLLLTTQPNGWSLRVHVFAEADDPAARFVPARPLSADVNSNKAYEQISAWLKDCQNHRDCRYTGYSHPLPRRLIRVLPRPHLIDTSGQHGEYITLSYCWGPPSSQAYVLTTANIASCYESLDLSRLSQSVLDAIEVTTKLNIEYLWIDALCIVQDSEDDKVKNLATMHLTYRNALMTLVAARAGAAKEGFLDYSQTLGTSASLVEQSHGLPRKSDTRFKVPFRCESDSWGTVYYEPSRDSTYYESKEPINQRAWTLQEHILSSRLLVYGTHTLQWRCQTSLCNFGNYVHNPQPKSLKLVSPGLSRRKPVHHGSQPIPKGFKVASSNANPWVTASTLSAEMLQWIDLIGFYTERQLTYSSDKLSALAGIADVWPRPPEWLYLAGLWSDALPQQLMWHAYDRLKAKRPVEYRAPSWSWACLDGDISYVVDGEDMSDGIELGAVSIIDGSTTLKYPNVPYGEVTHGVLRLQAPLLSCWYDTTTTDEVYGTLIVQGKLAEDYAAGWALMNLSAQRRHNDLTATFEVEEKDELVRLCLEEGIRGFADTKGDHFSRWIFCLPILVEDKFVKGIVLVADGEQFRRVGYFTNAPKKAFDREVQQIIELV